MSHFAEMMLKTTVGQHVILVTLKKNYCQVIVRLKICKQKIETLALRIMRMKS